MPSKKAKQKAERKAASGPGKVKEVNRLIRLARSHWGDHNNAACKRERTRALDLYHTLEEVEKEKIPQELRVWLRYRSEKYFGEGREGKGAHSRG